MRQPSVPVPTRSSTTQAARQEISSDRWIRTIRPSIDPLDAALFHRSARRLRTFTNTTATNATVNIRIGAPGSPSAACVGAPDTYLAMYNDAFNSASPLNNCALTNDDVNGAADRCSALSAISIPPGAVRVFVLAAFNNAATAAGIFPYEVTFAGTTPVSLQKFDVE